MKTTLLRRMLLMPASDHRPRLVEPILRGIAHPHTALTPEELAQVRADLALVEPKRCQARVWMHGPGGVNARPATPECGKPAVLQRLSACGYVSYRCAEHVSGLGYSTTYCPNCNKVFPADTHLVAELPL